MLSTAIPSLYPGFISQIQGSQQALRLSTPRVSPRGPVLDHLKSNAITQGALEAVCVINSAGGDQMN